MKLLPLLQTGGESSSPIDSIKDWESKRDAILQTLREMTGEPENLQPPPPYSELLDGQELESYTRKHIRIASEPDDWIPAYLLIPKKLSAHPAPVMIVLHQTVAQGKDEPCGIKGNPELALAQELVQRGYICLVPDVIGFGERIPAGAGPYAGAHDFYKKHPHWSFLGKMSWDIQRLVDWLETLPIADVRRIGIIGHSHGAYGAIFGAIFEPRISAVAASCGFTTLRRDPTPNRWSRLTALMPLLEYYIQDIKEAPFDWHEIVACLAPRPYFNWSTQDDRIFPNTDNFDEVFNQLREVYGLYGAAGLLEARSARGEHSFPREIRQEVYDWLDEHLAPRPNIDRIKYDLPASQEEWNAARSEIKKLLQRDIGPVDPPPLKPDYEVVSETEKEGYNEKKIRYLAAPDESITAYLLSPKDGAQHPAMIVFHQTVKDGKEEAVGHSGRPSIHFGPELARRGYIVLAPDSIAAGERIGPSGAFDTRDFYRRCPQLFAMGKMIQDGRRALDILQAVPNADPQRIGAIGHSLGAEEALFTAAFDGRIQAAAASCGYTPFRAEKNPSRWARDKWFSYMPRLRADLRAGWLPAWDFDDVIRLIAPRGYFNFQTTGDEIFPEGAAAHPLTLSARTIWRYFGVEDRLMSRLEPGKHDISPPAKDEIYAWLDRLLKNE